jgi:hypothetical protein
LDRQKSSFAAVSGKPSPRREKVIDKGTAQLLLYMIFVTSSST